MAISVRSRSNVVVNIQLSLAKIFESQMRDISREKIMERGVCIRIIGNLSLIPDDLRKLIAKVMCITRNNNKAFLNIAFAYTCEYR